MIDSKNAQIIRKDNESREITFKLNPMDYNGFIIFETALKTGYCRIRIEKPRKPRTTGKRSQNNNVRGTARQIHNHSGQGIESIIEYAKCKAVDEGIIPALEDENGMSIRNPWGYVRGTGESTWSTIEAAGVIEILRGIANDMGIKLKEYEK